MNELSVLHRRLRRLLRRRRWLRRGSAAAAAAIVLLSIAAGLFLADWLLEMSRPQRVLAMAAAVLFALLALSRFVRPWLGKRETELDAALWVQSQQQIDSELVAALQFESPAARAWGSEHLQRAVIGQAAALGSEIDVMQGFSIRPLVRRGFWLAVIAAAVAGGVWLFPQHAATFVDRLMLGTAHYPTATRIDALRINGQPIALNNGATRTTCPYGHAVVFQADCSGRLPPGGRAELRTPAGAAMGVTLEPLANREGGYGGQMARLVESVRYQVYLGDAWTDPAWLEVVPLPVVDLELIVTPPVYSGAEGRPAVLGGLRQVSVLEGSRVDVRIACDKPLRSAAITLDGRPLAMRRDMSARPAAAAERWLLPSAGTPLEAVTDAVRYSLQVTDRDGLELERPLVGVIRIKPDDPPRIVAGAVTRYVLPAAQPSIVFEAADDHGLAKIAARPQVTRAGGQVETGEELTVYVRQEPHPLETSIQNRYRLDLAPWGLAKGDRVEVTLEATDFRGPRAGKAGQAEPIVFEVTDQQGILAAMSESDRESAQQLETMIERQLDVGEER